MTPIRSPASAGPVPGPCAGRSGTPRSSCAGCSGRSIREGRKPPPPNILGDWLNRWLAEATHDVSPKTRERYTEIVTKHFIPALGAIRLAQLAPVNIQDYYSQALITGRRDGKGGLSAQTVRHHDRVLNVALKRARALRLIAVNPLEGVACPGSTARKWRSLSPTRLLACLPRRRPPVSMCRCSSRSPPGCAAGRSWRSLAGRDLPATTLRVAQGLEQTGVLRFKAPKTKLLTPGDRPAVGRYRDPPGSPDQAA